MMDYNSEIRAAIAAAGLIPPEHIEPGKLHRFPGADKKNGNTSGWCMLFDDCRGGVFGDWSTGLEGEWHAQRNGNGAMSGADYEDFKRRVAESQRERYEEEIRRHKDAQAKARAVWNAATPATDDHPYLARKGVRPHGVRVSDDGYLTVPMRDSGGVLHSLQVISPDGDKLFLPGGRVKGCYHSIGKPDGVLCIAEGYATGASIHQATGHAVAIAFSAGNLLPVAQALRAKFPDIKLVLCADDDWRTDGNPGLTKSTEAALAAGGLLAVPDFGDNRSEKDTDFNDMARLLGAEAVKAIIAEARPPEDAPNSSNCSSSEWPEPLSFEGKFEPEAYPTDALPDAIREAVEEVQGFTKAPAPLVAASALASLSIAAQAHADVKRAEKLIGPTSLFMLTIADSGERKSTCDGFFTAAIRQYQEEQVEALKPELDRHKAEMGAWIAERDGLLLAIKTASRKGKVPDEMRTNLAELQHHEPKPPRVPRFLYSDATPEALAYGLAKNWPSGGVSSAEAGIVFGAHGMGKDSVMRNLALLNVLWDGGNLTIDRRTTESFTARGARLTMALQVQEPTLRSFFDRTGDLARGTGFLARFLVSWPKSTQGFRPFTEAPYGWPALSAFNRRITEILAQPIPINEDGALDPPMLSLSEQAKEAWIGYHNAIESELAGGGELYDIRDVASKTADNAVRIAALFHVFEHGGGDIGLEAFECASRIAAWHLSESRRFFGELALPAELANAARLDSWLLDYCRHEKTSTVSTRTAQRLGPYGLRDKATLEKALAELNELYRAKLVVTGRKKEIHVNPALLPGGAS